MTPCDGCEGHNHATRSIRIGTSPGSGRAVRRNTCEACYAALGQPQEQIAYICQDCGRECALRSGVRPAPTLARLTARYSTPGTVRRSMRRYRKQSFPTFSAAPLVVTGQELCFIFYRHCSDPPHCQGKYGYAMRSLPATGESAPYGYTECIGRQVRRCSTLTRRTGVATQGFWTRRRERESRPVDRRRTGHSAAAPP